MQPKWYNQLVRRYRGEKLPEGCRIAVIANDALGNYIVATPLIQMLRRTHHPSALHYYSGSRTEELWSCDPNIDWGLSFDVERPGEVKRHAKGPYDLVINLETTRWAKLVCKHIGSDSSWACGPCAGEQDETELPYADDSIGRLAVDADWTSPDLQSRFPYLESTYIGEIFCRTAYLRGSIPAPRVFEREPTVPIPPVLIATDASLINKLWDPAKWIIAAQWIVDQGFEIGVVGASPEVQRHFLVGDTVEDEIIGLGLATDLRGKMGLPEVAGALRRARLCFSLDNGIMHMAASVGTPIVAMFRLGYDRLWTPPGLNVKALVPPAGKKVFDIETSEVVEALQGVLYESGN